MVGPTVARMLRICTPKSLNTFIMRFLFASNSSLSTKFTLLSESYCFSKLRVGYFQRVKGSCGLMGVERSVAPATTLPCAFSCSTGMSTVIPISASAVSSVVPVLLAFLPFALGFIIASGRLSSRKSTVWGSVFKNFSTASSSIPSVFSVISSLPLLWWTIVNFTLLRR